MKWELGKLVEDSVTGYQGVVVARAEYLKDTTRYQVQRTFLTDQGDMIKALWIPEGRLQEITH